MVSEMDAELMESAMVSQVKLAPISVLVCPQVTGPDGEGNYATGETLMLYMTHTMGNVEQMGFLEGVASALEGALEDVRQQMRDLGRS